MVTIIENSPAESTQEATRTGRASFGVAFATTLFLTMPVLGMIAAAVFGLVPSVGMVVLMVVLYYVSMFGVTIGWHRGLTHGGFDSRPWVKYALTVAGCFAFQGSPVGWVATHRKHHQFSDKPGDPHSPWTVRPGRFYRLRGLWHAQAGWLYDGDDTNVNKYAPDLLQDRTVMSVERTWWMYGLVGLLVIPGVVGFILDGPMGAITCIVWAGLIRLGLTHFFAWLTNSIGHMFGNRPFRTRDESTNIWWMVPFTVGEGWHNAHHAFGSSPRHGLLKGQLDPSARLIRLGEQAGLLTDVKWLPEDRIAKKLKPRNEW